MTWLKRLWTVVSTKLFGKTTKEHVGQHVIMPILTRPGKFVFYCPGCESNHIIDTNPSKYKSYHTLTGTYDRPTIRASVLSKKKFESGAFICHSFVTDGKIEFLKDCTHSLAGKTVYLPPC